MSLSQKRKENDSLDPLSLLRYSWTIDARNEVEALFEAMSRSSGFSVFELDRIVTAKRVGAGTYIIENVRKGTSIVARVSEMVESPRDMIERFLYQRPVRVHKRYIVTFYPRTYGSNDRRI